MHTFHKSFMRDKQEENLQVDNKIKTLFKTNRDWFVTYRSFGLKTIRSNRRRHGVLIKQIQKISIRKRTRKRR